MSPAYIFPSFQYRRAINVTNWMGYIFLDISGISYIYNPLFIRLVYIKWGFVVGIPRHVFNDPAFWHLFAAAANCPGVKTVFTAMNIMLMVLPFFYLVDPVSRVVCSPQIQTKTTTAAAARVSGVEQKSSAMFVQQPFFQKKRVTCLFIF